MENQKNNQPALEIKNLGVSVAGKAILNGVSLTINPGEVHALMGPNGSGKSTLSYTITGHPRYKIDAGQIIFKGMDLLSMPIHERARQGLFLAFQYPQEIQGVGMGQFLFAISKAVHPQDSAMQTRSRIDLALQKISLDRKFLERQLNLGFSGGEKKRCEIMQMALMEPRLAILDETDSGLDVDALSLIGQAVSAMRGPEFSALVITHYPAILHHLKPDVVHVMVNGKIVATGGPELASQIENDGYRSFTPKDRNTKNCLSSPEADIKQFFKMAGDRAK